MTTKRTVLSRRLLLILAPSRDIKGRKLSNDRALSLICFMLASYSHSILVWRGVVPGVFDCDLGEITAHRGGRYPPIGLLYWAPAPG